MEEFKPCPFCGSEAVMMHTGIKGNLFGFKRCPDCGAPSVDFHRAGCFETIDGIAKQGLVTVSCSVCGWTTYGHDDVAGCREEWNAVSVKHWGYDAEVEA